MRNEAWLRQVFALLLDDLKAIGTLMEEIFDRKIEPFQEAVRLRFDEVDKQVDYLFKQDEKREQELLLIVNQLDRIEKTQQRHEQQFDDLDERVRILEKRTA